MPAAFAISRHAPRFHRHHNRRGLERREKRTEDFEPMPAGMGGEADGRLSGRIAEKPDTRLMAGFGPAADRTNGICTRPRLIRGGRLDDVLVEKRLPLNILHRRFAVFSMIFMNVPGGSSRTTPCQGDYE
jgi:hypothetical protein